MESIAKLTMPLEVLDTMHGNKKELIKWLGGCEKAELDSHKQLRF